QLAVLQPLLIIILSVSMFIKIVCLKEARNRELITTSRISLRVISNHANNSNDMKNLKIILTISVINLISLSICSALNFLTLVLRINFPLKFDLHESIGYITIIWNNIIIFDESINFLIYCIQIRSFRKSLLNCN